MTFDTNQVFTDGTTAVVDYNGSNDTIAIRAKKGVKGNKSKIIHSSLESPFTPVRRLEFDDLRYARSLAHPTPYSNTIPPNRYKLIEFYNSIVQDDAHLRAVLIKFKRNILNKKYKIIDRRTGEIDIDKTNLLKKPWFHRYLGYFMETYSYGYSTLNFIRINDKRKEFNFKIELVNRQNISPEGQFIRHRPYDQWGTSFEEFRNNGFNIFHIELPDNDLGLLNTVAMIATYTRHSWGNWMAAAQLMTTFIRVLKTADFHDAETKAKLDEFLGNMGKTASLVVPLDTEMDIKETSRSDFHKVLKEAITLTNELMTKLYLGGTMTMDNGSSKAQGNVHKETEIEGTDAIKQDVVFNVNDELLPYMFETFGFGIEPDKYEFVWDDEQELSISDRMKNIDSHLLPYLTKEYLEKTYNVELKDDIQQQLNVANSLAAKKKVNSIVASVNKLYSPKHSHFQAASFEVPDNQDIINKIIEAVFNSEDGDIDTSLIDELINSYAEKLEEAIDEGFGDGDFDTEDTAFLQALKDNARVFSKAKASSQFVEITNLLTDEDGKLRTFSEFKSLALDLHDTFNSTWLRTEYNTAVAGSQAARKWLDIEENAEALPLLKYVTVGDNNVRDEHKKLEDIILPINHSFWITHYPPNGFACRCTVQQLADGTTTTQQELINLKIEDLDPTFNNNVGITKQLFTNSHPYFNQ